MNVNRRDRRDTDVPRSAGQRTPRSGGRTAAQRTTGGAEVSAGDRSTDPRGARSRGAQEHAVQGSAALKPVQRAANRTAAAAPAGPRLRVAPPPPVTVPRAPFVALILVLVVGGVLGILVINTKINENAFRLDKLQQQQAKLNIDEQQLKKEIADAEAPGNLTANARKLGLVESDQPAFIRLPDGRLIGVPQPAGGQPSITSQQGTGG